MARTRALDYDDKRLAILRQSAGVIADRGVERASMSLIALKCGVSKALLYHYYTNKEELVFDILYSYLESLEASVAAADDPTLAPTQRLHRLVYTTLHHYRDSDEQHQVQLDAIRTLPPDRVEALREIERSIVRRFSGVIAAVNPALNHNRPQLMPVTMSLFGMMNWVYMWFREDGPMSRETLADLITRMLLDGVRSFQDLPAVDQSPPVFSRSTNSGS